MPSLVSGISAVAAIGVFCGFCLAQDGSHPDLTGKWQMDASKSEMQLSRFSGLTMTISEKDGKIVIDEDQTLSDGKARKVSYTCTVDGKECDAHGEKAKASFWYNGPMLVSMETQRNGATVVRHRLKLSQDSKELTDEVSSLVPQSEKTDKLVFAKR